MTQWFNPPFSVNANSSRPVPVNNSFGIAVLFAVDVDTAQGITNALNLLHRLGYNPERNAIGVA